MLNMKPTLLNNMIHVILKCSKTNLLLCFFGHVVIMGIFCIISQSTITMADEYGKYLVPWCKS